MRFLLITEEELDYLADSEQFMFDDLPESDIYYDVKSRGFIELPIDK